jgi:hypothetical protein
MKTLFLKQLLIISLLFLFGSLVKAQSITMTITEASKRFVFVIKPSTSNTELKYVDSAFKANGIETKIRAIRKNRKISELNISVNCDKGKTNYQTNNPKEIKEGISILVDRRENAGAALCVGRCK